MKRVMVGLLCVLVLSMGVVSAQDNQPVELPNGAVVTLPEGWSFEDQAGVYYFTADASTYFAVYLPQITAATTADAVDTPPTPTGLLIYMVRDVMGVPIGESRITTREDGVEFTFMETAGPVRVAVIETEGGLIFFELHASFTSLNDTAAIAEDVIAQITPSLSGGVCYVSTDETYGVPMRLGPGTNRGEFTTLTPAQGQVLVLGQATASDGSLWWRVEENEAAVEELWVADADVITSGACATVGLVDAPPIIHAAPPLPGAPAPPAAEAPADSGSPAAPAAPAAPGDTSLIPRSGLWNMTASNELLASCEGGDTVRIPIDLGYTGGTVRLTTSNGGQTLTMSEPGGVTVFTGAGPGLYTVNTSLEDNMYGVFYIHVNASTSIWGEIVVGWVDIPCSGTLPVSFAFIG